jgi:hypothetical protein
MRYPPEVLERVRAATDLVALIGEQVKLIKAGRSYKGLCPFHQEKTPSFTVNPTLGVYHCFGCGKGQRHHVPHGARQAGSAGRAPRRTDRHRTPNVMPTPAGRRTGRPDGAGLAAERYRERFLHPVAAARAT